MSKRKEQSMSLYRSIEELPIWNWDKIKTTGDKRYLIIDGECDNTEELDQLWDDLQQEFNERIGFSESGGYHFQQFIQLQRLIRDEIIYSCEEYNPKLSKTIIKRKQLEKELEETVGQSQELEDQAIQLEIFFNRDFNVKQTSVLRWFKYLKEYEKRIEQLSKENK